MIVDGYNVIGSWPELQKLKLVSLEEARLGLIRMMEEYQAISGIRIILVFDAYQVAGPAKDMKVAKIDVFFTGEHETADELIERLVARLKHKRRSIFVATSDQIEQTVIFGQGAYRIPVRELYQWVQEARQQISNRARSTKAAKTRLDSILSPEQKYLLEKIRRKK